ncbi:MULTISPECIES: EamA family transporter [Hydrocarboniphaga]|uniref:EamA family transporter n=1 Tax=Hydrocarboniphaga TaxID=243627 RepID=UPI002AB9E37E|nr:EamA family transporter [Hydrocarboniphaga sp.]MDZ4079978.1 EamA family transporter [Hydrocarboniphaga sp.]
MELRKVQLALAFAAVYLIWGSTYLAIRIVVEALPPASSAGVRFLVAGLTMVVVGLLTGASLPRRWSDWRSTIFVGTLMLVFGNGLVTWSELWVPSNQAALIVATSALWMGWMGTLGSKGEKLGAMRLIGLLVGFAGVIVLVGEGIGGGLAPWTAYAALMLAPIAWAVGSVVSKRSPVSIKPVMAAGLQMLVAGVLLSAIGLLAGEAGRWTWAPRSLWALAYLIVFGSCVAYGAFYWLVHEVSPVVLGTYAYVNPAIAVLLGWWILDERLGRDQIIGTGIILVGVLLVTLGSARRR